jgi:NAD(P)-dependent dehydrogenase (short-subunit alcohol dehydrogenase family)
MAGDVMPSDASTPEGWPFTEAERLACLTVLRALKGRTAAFLDRSQPGFAAAAEVRSEANRLIAAIQEAVRARHPLRGARKRAEAQPDSPARPAGAPPNRPACYVCHRPIERPHSFYAALCPPCGELNRLKREQTADLSGRAALVTGGRRGIGYQTALKLLRAGARVEVTTRFPCDAALRYGREPDLGDWSARLRIHGLDLRDLGAIERFTDLLQAGGAWLDVLVNNAAQTVRRPPAFYASLLPAEQQGPAGLPAPLAGLVCPGQYHAVSGQHARAGLLPASTGQEAPGIGLSPGPVPAPALLALVPLLPGDESADTGLFPTGQRDGSGQQLDLRRANSWTAKVDEVALVELAEVHCVNALAPFVLLKQLLPALRRSAWPRRFVVNVASREGWFERGVREGFHPHTNMAKASLNMLTRTVAPELAAEGIFVCSVDPGWVSEQRPTPDAERQRAAGGFVPPLDEVDGAARVLDPVFTGVREADRPPFGRLFKDYQAVNW